MKIIRNGKEIELTADEIFRAYLEQERIYDIQNIKDNASSYLDEPEYRSLMDSEAVINKAADILRIDQDKYNMDFENALEEAYAFVRKNMEAVRLS